MNRNRDLDSLSVIVPVYNRVDEIETLLESLAGELHRIEVVVVDDCSPDPHLYNDLAARYPGVRFVRQDRNRHRGRVGGFGNRPSGGCRAKAILMRAGRA